MRKILVCSMLAFGFLAITSNQANAGPIGNRLRYAAQNFGERVRHPFNGRFSHLFQGPCQQSNSFNYNYSGRTVVTGGCPNGQCPTGTCPKGVCPTGNCPNGVCPIK